ncbi:MAG TPA: uridine diphosphate-N-acetylglucosamine-binding protein YvcK [Acidimicrobiales bacterium]|nr:uridine diphosphate-N-acetylglucosamine-binding protein YvcK [Acidimicrobiales bacterium]
MTAGSGAGLSVVALGGGHGLASTLQAVRRYAAAVTAVVSVADDGGSSGRLRETFHIPPPGDLRRCLVALGDPDSVWARAYEYRFEAGELEGHALGNLIITGLAATTGDFIAALEEAARMVGATGRVLPATADPVVLKAEAVGGDVEGQVAVATAGRITRVSVVPPDAEPPAAVVEAILEADQVVLGPGSLYTSVLAVAAVPGIARALADTPAQLTYVCNLRPQEPETAGYDVAAHLAAFRVHEIDLDVVLFDPDQIGVGQLPAGIRACSRALARADGGGHDPARLAEALSGLVG